MRRILTICALGVVCSALALAENFAGKLIDGSCYDTKKDAAACDATATTNAFALSVGAKVYKLDEAGNAKAAEAMKNRADRSAEPGKPASTAVLAKVTGAKEANDTIKVEAIEVQ